MSISNQITEHTPWHVAGDGLDVRDSHEDNIVTVECGDDPELAEARARLIAAAPELLQAAKGIEAVIKTLLDEAGGQQATDWGIVNNNLVALNDAIAKARCDGGGEGDVFEDLI